MNKPASASSENTSSQLGVEAAERANDGDETTKWCAKVTDSSDDSWGRTGGRWTWATPTNSRVWKFSSR
ncbi:hypothetical protein [Anaeromassilibacillus sp. SJQ-1]|uniref:hypothetical protein n=1 Tax=Anaeromassilibacillus sp. SJQ-1 TaxID=3375419 RepID=UPI003988B7F9